MQMKMVGIAGLIWITLNLSGQNLVRNPGFENNSGCPETGGEIHLVSRWFSANTGTPDYFNDCSSKMEYGTEFNRKGGQVARSGKAYVGLQAHLLNKNEFFEYVETLLDTALISGKYYCISIWVSCGKGDYAFSEFGAAVSTAEIRQNNSHKIRVPYIPMKKRGYLDAHDEWICLHGIYRARGGERFLTIGHFATRDDFWSLRTGSLTDSLFKSAYYFLDDVYMTMVPDSSSCSCP